MSASILLFTLHSVCNLEKLSLYCGYVLATTGNSLAGALILGAFEDSIIANHTDDRKRVKLAVACVAGRTRECDAVLTEFVLDS